jgi:hypothetical protein
LVYARSGDLKLAQELVYPMDDLYDMVKDGTAFRKKKAEEYGIGFELPGSVSLKLSECKL